jgi:hypothetical protein
MIRHETPDEKYLKGDTLSIKNIYDFEFIEYTILDVSHNRIFAHVVPKRKGIEDTRGYDTRISLSTFALDKDVWIHRRPSYQKEIEWE